jgi:asparagine synthase (glutamine-hydrolysing)
VSLSGLGGDQLFCGDHFPPVHLADLLRRGELCRYVAELRHWLARGEYSLWDLLYRYSGVRAPSHLRADPAPPSWLTARCREAVRAKQRELFAYGNGAFRTSPAMFHYNDIANAPLLQPLWRTSFETRLPLLWRPLVEFIIGIPWQYKISANQDRVIQRRALREILPAMIATREDKGTTISLMLRGVRKNWARVRTLARGEHLGDLGLVDPRAFQAACERYRHGVTNPGTGYLQAALSLEEWLVRRVSLRR